MSSPPHFEGKSVEEHLRAARKKGSIAAAEPHGVEMSGSAQAGFDALREVALVLLMGWMFQAPLVYLAIGLCLWKTIRSALLGRARIERLHRLIEQERWEIEHHRPQERQELLQMYEAKGFSGTQLEEVIDVLMADDNRLLRVMLEEELGLSLEICEHPLIQAGGALVGASVASVLCLVGFWIEPTWGLPTGVLLSIGLGTFFAAKQEGNDPGPFVLWHLGAAALIGGILYYLMQLTSNAGELVASALELMGQVPLWV